MTLLDLRSDYPEPETLARIALGEAIGGQPTTKKLKADR
jgi:hypothetical protein